jgi:hypothetical protein
VSCEYRGKIASRKKYFMHEIFLCVSGEHPIQLQQQSIESIANRRNANADSRLLEDDDASTNDPTPFASKADCKLDQSVE